MLGSIVGPLIVGNYNVLRSSSSATLNRRARVSSGILQPYGAKPPIGNTMRPYNKQLMTLSTQGLWLVQTS